MDSVRERIIQALEARAATIPVVGAKVVRGITGFTPEDCPVVTILPGVETASKRYGEQVCAMPVEINAAGSFGAEGASKASEALLADMVKALSPVGGQPLLGGLADSMEYAGGGVEAYPEPGQSFVAVLTTWNITYTTKFGDPFAQE